VPPTPGRARLALSRVGLGLAALGRPGYINLGHAADLAGGTDVRSMEHNARRVLDAALDGGVRYFDAARSYGKAEAFLGSWLRDRGLRPGEITVASKWGYTCTAGWRVDAEVQETKDLSVATLRRQLAETRQLLGEHLSLYQIHSATLPSGVLEDREVLDELAGLRQSGVGVGLTVTGLGAGADAVALAAVLAQPWADVVLSGASTVAMLRSNLTASALEISRETLAAMAELREEPEDYWRTRSALLWN
jgi:aryl-alcohol dehydrogenase-like predicted oxidoreductase